MEKKNSKQHQPMSIIWGIFDYRQNCRSFLYQHHLDESIEVPLQSTKSHIKSTCYFYSFFVPLCEEGCKQQKCVIASHTPFCCAIFLFFFFFFTINPVLACRNWEKTQLVKTQSYPCIIRHAHVCMHMPEMACTTACCIHVTGLQAECLLPEEVWCPLVTSTSTKAITL